MTKHERVTLAEFLGRLEEEPAAEARAAAARIDELSRIGNAMEGIEHRFLPWAVVAAAAFVAGVVLFFFPSVVPRWVTVLCLGALPTVAVTYAFRVRPRSRADASIETLNIKYFLPHGGLYFAEGARPACVVVVPAQDGTGPGYKLTQQEIWW